MYSIDMRDANLYRRESKNIVPEKMDHTLFAIDHGGYTLLVDTTAAQTLPPSMATDLELAVVETKHVKDFLKERYNYNPEAHDGEIPYDQGLRFYANIEF